MEDLFVLKVLKNNPAGKTVVGKKQLASLLSDDDEEVA